MDDDKMVRRWGQHLGFNICWRRLVLRLTVEEAAKRALISPERWLEIEQGGVNGTTHEYDCIAYVLKVSSFDLLFRYFKEIDIVPPRMVH